MTIASPAPTRPRLPVSTRTPGPQSRRTAVANVGVANHNPVSGRAICWIIPGHAQHHLGILAERYGVKP